MIAERGEEARKELLNQFLTASNFAGLAFGTAGCAAVHAMSYPLGGTFHVAHGEANYAVFIGVMKKYMEIRQDGKIQKLNHFLSELLGCSYEEGVHTVVNALAIVSGIVCDGRRHPARPRLLLLWTQRFWATICISEDRNSAAETEL